MAILKKQVIQTKPQHFPSLKPIRNMLIAAFLLVICGHFASNYWRWVSEQYINACPSNNITKIEDIVQFTIPTHHENLWSHCSIHKGYVGWVAFEINPSDLHDLAATSFVKRVSALDSNTLPFEFPDEAINAKMHNSTRYLYGESNGAAPMRQYILVDTADASKWIVYLKSTR